MSTGSAFGSREKKIPTPQRPSSISAGVSCAAYKVERLPPSVLGDKRGTMRRVCLLVEIIRREDAPVNGFDDSFLTLDERAADHFRYAAHDGNVRFAVRDCTIHFCSLSAFASRSSRSMMCSGHTSSLVYHTDSRPPCGGRDRQTQLLTN